MPQTLRIKDNCVYQRCDAGVNIGDSELLVCDPDTDEQAGQPQFVPANQCTLRVPVDHFDDQQRLYKLGRILHRRQCSLPIVDRLIHHSHIFMLCGESYQLKQKMSN